MIRHNYRYGYTLKKKKYNNLGSSTLKYWTKQIILHQLLHLDNSSSCQNVGIQQNGIFMNIKANGLYLYLYRLWFIMFYNNSLLLSIIYNEVFNV